MTSTEQKFKEEVDRLLPGVRNNAEHYPMTIERLNSGYIVCVGCKKFAIESKDKVNELIKVYLELLESCGEEQNINDLWYRYCNPGNYKSVPMEDVGAVIGNGAMIGTN